MAKIRGCQTGVTEQQSSPMQTKLKGSKCKYFIICLDICEHLNKCVLQKHITTIFLTSSSPYYAKASKKGNHTFPPMAKPKQVFGEKKMDEIYKLQFESIVKYCKYLFKKKIKNSMSGQVLYIVC